MDLVFFLNSIIEFNHTHPIINECKTWLIATESSDLLQYVKQNYSQMVIYKVKLQDLEIFSPKVVVFADDWIFINLHNIFFRRPRYKQIKTFHGIIDKTRIYNRARFKDTTSFHFKLFVLLSKLKLEKFSPLSDNPFKFIDNLRLDRLIPNRYDLILLSGKRMGKNLLKKRLLTPTNFAKVGVPKTDLLFANDISSRETLEDLGLDPNKKTILYAPTWSTSKNLCLSSIPFFGVALCKAVKDDMNFIFKPHQNVKRLNEFPEQINDMRQIIEQNENMRFLDPNIDAISLMRASDLLITDFSSVAMEFFLLNKPLIFLDHLGERYSDPNVLDIQIREAGEIVDNNKNLATTITYCLDNPHKKEKIREQFARDLFYYSKSKTKSAVRAAKAIESFLEKIKINK